MEEACPAGHRWHGGPGGPDRQKVEEACDAVSKGDYVACPANLNSPDQLVLSGDMAALKEVVGTAERSGL